MFRLLFFTVIGAAFAWGAILFLQNPGEIQVNYMGYEIITSVPLFVIALLIAVYLFNLFIKAPLSFLFTKRNVRRQDAKNTVAYAMALAAVMKGDVKGFNKHLRKLWFSLNVKAKNATLVLEALVAKENDKDDDFLKAIDKLIQDPDFSDFAYKEKVEFFRFKKDYETALTLAMDAYVATKSEWVYRDLVELEIQAGSIEKAQTYLEEALKAKLMNKDEGYALKSVILFMLSEMPYKEAEKEKLLLEAHKINPGYVIVAEKLALLYIQEKKNKKAMSVLEESFKIYPALPLYRVYVQAMSDATDVEKLKAVEKMVSGIDEDLKTFIMTDIYMKISLWGQAWNEMKKYIENHELTPALCKMLSKIEKFSGIQYHITECVVASSDENTFDAWACDECGYISPSGYKVQCDNCGAIGSVDWNPAP